MKRNSGVIFHSRNLSDVLLSGAWEDEFRAFHRWEMDYQPAPLDSAKKLWFGNIFWKSSVQAKNQKSVLISYT